MPNRATRRSNGDTDQDQDQFGFKVSVDGNPYEIRIAEMTALDEMDFHEKVGQTFMEAMGSPSSYTVACFVWLLRRKYEKRLQFEEVLKEVRFRDVLDTQPLVEDEDEEEDARSDTEPPVNGANPELSGGPSVPTSLGSPQSTA